jgi:hypothetical protein
MKFSVAAVVLFSSIATSFAGNFTPIPKNKIVQVCAVNCQTAFDLCVKLSAPPPLPPPTVGTQQTTPTVPLVVGNCEGDLKICLLVCQANPRG